MSAADVGRNLTNQELISIWEKEKSFSRRDALLQQLQERDLFPTIYDSETRQERHTGVYPSLDDPNFTQKLLQKQEFYENRQDSLKEQADQGVNPCDPDGEFELTPVQRFIGRFLSPECPYQSALLFHGVGVGKTCAGITVAENYLRRFPRKKVLIVAPPTIQPGFRRTIFDIDGLIIDENEDIANIAKGCTGNTYLKRTGMENQKDRKVIAARVKALIDSRYSFMGYTQFQNYIASLLKRVPKYPDEERHKQEEIKLLRREFSGRMLIIDEAHNLRDVPGETEDDNLDAPAAVSVSDSAAGKKLTPTLLKLLESAQGMKLVLMTGTPMYNNYREIIFLMNLMLINDKQVKIYERDIFMPDGRFTENGEKILGAAASRYVSFMRGENPLSFPVRLKPAGTAPKLDGWPTFSPNGSEVPPDIEDKMLLMPFIPVSFEGAAYEEYENICDAALEQGNLGIRAIDEMVQSGNWIFPGQSKDASSRIREAGFKGAFEEVMEGMTARYKSHSGISPEWLQKDKIKRYSPKAHFILNRIATAKGVVFIYSRYIKAGGLSLAIALEANGYTLHGRERGLFINGVVDGKGRQCAECPRRESEHRGAGHAFVAAKYILLTGNAEISHNNPAAVDAVRSAKNIVGNQIKVIIGSQVASEGVDFRFIREIYVFDSWFHLNKLEQVIGRGVRTCSHALLEPEFRNCTIYWITNVFNDDRESADLYMYRNAFQKAVQVGRITRCLKRYALDCNLNRAAILVQGFAPQTHIDSQGAERTGVDVNDTPFTSMCDWIENCEYTCANPVNFSVDVDMSTYDEYASRWRESIIKQGLKRIFEENDQVMLQFDDLLALSAIPPLALKAILSDILENDYFQLVVAGKKGHLVYKNGYYLFQPEILRDESIPLSLRLADIPVKRDFYEYKPYVRGPPAPVVAVAPPAAVVPVAEEAAPVAPTEMEFWRLLTEWTRTIEEGSADLTLPSEIVAALTARYPGSQAEQKVEIQRMSMILWLYAAMRDNPDWRRTLARAVLELVWDDTFTITEQHNTLRDGSGLAMEIGQEQYRRKGTTNVFRYIDYNSGEIKYLCNDAPCAPAIANLFDRDMTDSMNKLVTDQTKTGKIYGFLVPKKGYLVFKTSQPPRPGGKPEKGGECAIVSQISTHFALLEQIGAVLREIGLPDFDMNPAELTNGDLQRRKFQNSTRACLLKELILRWMDIMGLDGKRWFYRPISAYKTGHRFVPPKK
jgi:hypothetical protein